MSTRPKSVAVVEKNAQFVPGGVLSGARMVEPIITFCRGQGAYLWDVDGKRYIDYHAAFAPHILGHNDSYVNEAVKKVLDDGASLYGSGTSELEGRLAELICSNAPAAEKIEFLNTGSEATIAAVRLARTVTGREHVIAMQGGFNGSHNELACNVLTPLEKIGPRVSPGEYPYIRLGPGLPAAQEQLVHVVNFNDLESVRHVCEHEEIAALITEPVLQNIGIVKPQPGYLEGLRKLADEYGFVLIFDEVKTGFRHGLGGYSKLSGVQPDLIVFAKAVANGFPLAVLGGKAQIMDQYNHPDSSLRPLVGGTYSGHPVSMAAGIATIERLLEGDGTLYAQMDDLGAMAQAGIEDILRTTGVTGTVSRLGSAFCIYFMDHPPTDYHDLATHHDFDRDVSIRHRMIDEGIYFFPVATKQCSISAAHTKDDVAATLEALRKALEE